MNYSEILAGLNKINLNTKRFKLSLLSNSVVNPLKDIIDYYLKVDGVNSDLIIGEHDNIIQEAINCPSDSILIIFWDVQNIHKGLYYKYDLLSKEEITDIIEKQKSDITFLFKNVMDKPLVLLNEFCPLFISHHHDYKTNIELICDEVNAFVRKQKPDNVRIVPISKIISKIGVNNSYNKQYHRITSTIYTNSFFIEYAIRIKPPILSSIGRTKKVLVLDCDNTLWDGIYGEDGDNIECFPEEKKGVFFYEVQFLLKALKEKGTLLAICSKNNIEDIKEAFEKKDNMPLTLEDFTVIKANWKSKSENILDIANDLNLGLDSLVFIDDSDFEINQVSSHLQDVLCCKVPKKLSNYPDLIHDISCLFVQGSITNEDKGKSLMYKQESERHLSKKNYSNIDDYLKSLMLEIEFNLNNRDKIPRLAQLTKKTNQFNVTTKRYNEEQIKGFIAQHNKIVIDFNLFDNFGDYGTCGLAILSLKDTTAKLDTFLMSCRVLGRNVEYLFFEFIINILKKKGIKSLNCFYIETKKNIQCKDLFDRFKCVLISENNGLKEYSLHLNNFKSFNIDYIKYKIK